MFSYHSPDDEDFDVHADGRTQPFYQDEKGFHTQVGRIDRSSSNPVFKFQSEKDPSYFTAIKLLFDVPSIEKAEAEQKMMETVHGFCRLTNYGTADPYRQNHLLLMPFLSGVSFEKYVDDAKEFEDICQLYCATAQSLDELHKKHRIAHKDFDQINFLINSSKKVLIFDFGESKLLDSVDKSEIQPLLRCDIFSLSSIFSGETIFRKLKIFSPILASLINNLNSMLKNKESPELSFAIKHLELLQLSTPLLVALHNNDKIQFAQLLKETKETTINILFNFAIRAKCAPTTLDFLMEFKPDLSFKYNNENAFMAALGQGNIQHIAWFLKNGKIDGDALTHTIKIAQAKSTSEKNSYPLFAKLLLGIPPQKSLDDYIKFWMMEILIHSIEDNNYIQYESLLDSYPKHLNELLSNKGHSNHIIESAARNGNYKTLLYLQKNGLFKYKDTSKLSELLSAGVVALIKHISIEKVLEMEPSVFTYPGISLNVPHPNHGNETAAQALAMIMSDIIIISNSAQTKFQLIKKSVPPHLLRPLFKQKIFNITTKSHPCNFIAFTSYHRGRAAAITILEPHLKDEDMDLINLYDNYAFCEKIFLLSAPTISELLSEKKHLNLTTPHPVNKKTGENVLLDSAFIAIKRDDHKELNELLQHFPRLLLKKFDKVNAASSSKLDYRFSDLLFANFLENIYSGNLTHIIKLQEFYPEQFASFLELKNEKNQTILAILEQQKAASASLTSEGSLTLFSSKPEDMLKKSLLSFNSAKKLSFEKAKPAAPDEYNNILSWISTKKTQHLKTSKRVFWRTITSKLHSPRV